MSLVRTRLLAVRSLDDAVALMAEIGYDKPALRFDLGEAPLPGVAEARVARSTSRRRSGYGLVIAETAEEPRSLRPLAKAMRTYVHDKPLGIVGVTDGGRQWTKMILVRPRGASAGSGVTVTKLVIDLEHPSQHDANVMGQLAWRSGDDSLGQRAIDRALDVEAVTNRFFVGLREHYSKLRDAVLGAMDDDPAVRHNLKELGEEPAERTALRILTQVLFVEFLQRKGFVEGHTDWLSRAFRAKVGPYYPTVLEPLFYGGLGTPIARRHAGAPAVPYLNGGLFDRFYGDISLPLPDEVFDTTDGLLGYLAGWTFTVSEEMPDESEVAVDPEMLGKVFEHLAGEEAVEKHGTVYTPRPVVHFMCREALAPWVQEQTSLSENEVRLLLSDPDPFAREALGQTLDGQQLTQLAAELPERLDTLRVLDPAVGSGAFLLGMLSELIRLRSLCFKVLNQGTDPGPHQVTAWKEHAIRETLYGVDIEPRAIELCRLRLWLSLMVDLPEGVTPQPLPNLEYRTVVANSLTDFYGGVQVQDTRGGLDPFHNDRLVELHTQWFHAVGDERESLLSHIAAAENAVIDEQLGEALVAAKTDAEREQVEEVRRRFHSAERRFPCFVPALHAPEPMSRGGWDIVIMNPPYVGRKEVAQRLDKQQIRDLTYHYGETNDLMVLFAHRALQLVRPRGAVAMIFNDSITTSSDAQNLRRQWMDRTTLLSMARTRCFVGRAITGGVVVLRADRPGDIPARGVRWVEGHGRPVEHFVEASKPLTSPAHRGHKDEAGSLELWSPPLSDYKRLPHRPLFRPSGESLHLLSKFEACRDWSTIWGLWDLEPNWRTLSNTQALRRIITTQQQLAAERRPGDEWTLLGLVIEGGQGLATADDRRFLAAVSGTPEAADHLRRQENFDRIASEHPTAGMEYTELRRQMTREDALLAIWNKYGSSLRWPRIGAFRVVGPEQVRRGPLTDSEKLDGIAGEDCFVFYEKGDDSDEVEGQRMGARWFRDNATVIDWSTTAVSVLRARAHRKGAQSPRLQNEQFWFQPGVAWNRTASYLRVRRVPANAIFSSEAPTIVPQVEWLTANGLMALLNSSVADFILRTFLSSRMHLDVGDVRRLPVPVLTIEQSENLTDLGERAVETKAAGDRDGLRQVEEELDAYVLSLYGLPVDADLWVPR